MKYFKALELNRDFAKAWLQKGDALRTLGKLQEALAAYDEVRAKFCK